MKWVSLADSFSVSQTALGSSSRFSWVPRVSDMAKNPPNYPVVPLRPVAGYLDQGWGYDTAEWWHHVSQGAVFMPYQWFIALEQASGDELFAATDHLERLGLSR